MGCHLGKPIIISRKYRNSKMHIIHPTTERHSSVTPPFSILRTLGPNDLTQSLLYNDVLTISLHLLRTVLKVKSRTAVRVQSGSALAAHPCDHVAGGSHSPLLPPRQRMVPRVTGPGRSTFKIQSQVSTEYVSFSHHQKVMLLENGN